MKSGLARISNEYIQKATMGFSMMEYRLMLHLLARVNSYDVPDTVYQVGVDEICKRIGYNPQTHRAARGKVKATLKALADRSAYMKSKDSKGELGESLVRIFDRIRIKEDNSICYTLHKDFLIYVLNITQKYTQIDPFISNAIDSPFVMRLYLLMKSYANLGRKYMSMEELACSLYDLKQHSYTVQDETGSEDGAQIKVHKPRKVENYKLLSDIRKACAKVNDLTDIQLKLEIKSAAHNKVNGINFIIEALDDDSDPGYYECCHETQRSRKRRETIENKAAQSDAQKIIEDIFEYGEVDLDEAANHYPDAGIVIRNILHKAPGIDDPAEYVARFIGIMRPAFQIVLQ